jgi:hypothetical protein
MAIGWFSHSQAGGWTNRLHLVKGVAEPFLCFIFFFIKKWLIGHAAKRVTYICFIHLCRFKLIIGSIRPTFELYKFNDGFEKKYK